MDGQLISDDLRLLIRKSIGSVWALELLILISREAARSWTSEDLNRDLRGSLALVEEILLRFVAAGLVATEPDGRFTFRPATPELARLVEQLQQEYATRPLAVVREIVSAPNAKIQTFADAFKVKKD
jgi:hypothetical protein